MRGPLIRAPEALNGVLDWSLSNNFPLRTCSAGHGDFQAKKKNRSRILKSTMSVELDFYALNKLTALGYERRINMKIRNICTILPILVFAAILFVSVNTAISSDVTELDYAGIQPATHEHSKLSDQWCKEIEKRTNGKVKLTFYPAGTLLKGPQVFTGVMDGIADVGHGIFGYTPGTFPTMQAFALPMGYPSSQIATRIINEFEKKFQPKSLRNVKLMYIHACSPGIIHSKKPIHSLDDMRGIKIRGYGYAVDLAKALGAVPIAMGQGDTYEALQKGIVEATFSPYEVLKGWKQAEVIGSSLECYNIAYSAGFYVVMNLEKWNSLPVDVQTTIEQINAEWIPKHADAWAQADAEGFEYTLERGNQTTSLSEEESVRWVKAVRPVLEKYIKETKKKGLPAEEYIAFIKSKLAEYRQ